MLIPSRKLGASTLKIQIYSPQMLLSCLFSSLVFIKFFSPCHKTLSVSGKVLLTLFSSLTLDKELNASDVIQANSGWEWGFEIGR